MSAGLLSSLFGYGILSLMCFIVPNCVGQQSTYVIENRSGCVNNTVTSWNITDYFQLYLLFNNIVTVCTLTGIPGGDPLIQITTNYIGRVSCGVDVVQKYTFICFNDTVTVSDAGVYTAKLGTDITAYNNTLFVMRPPTKPVISLQGNLINQRQHNLTCTSVSTSVPTTGLPVMYTWTVNGAVITDSRFVVIGSGNSKLMIDTVQKQDRGKRIRCIATEEKGVSSGAGDETILDVMYVPEVSVGPPSRVAILGDNNVKLVCTVVDTNPSIRSFRWTKGGSQISTNQNYTITTVQKSDIGTYQCTASNSVGTSQPATVTFDVQYPPTVSPLTDRDIIEGRDLITTCSVTNGNPSQTTVYWTKPGDSGFIQNGVTLEIRGINRSGSGNYTCTAENTYTVGRKGTGSQSVDINVLYPPTVSTLTNRDIIEGSDLKITCSVTNGNPSQTTVYWTKSGDSGFRQNGATLQIKGINRSGSGNYTCTAENTYTVGGKGTGSQSVDVNVLYAPLAAPQLTADGSTSVDEGQFISLRCTLSTLGNPSITWSWVCGDDTLTTGVTNAGTQSALTVRANRKYNNRACYCRATSPLYNRTSGKQTITVYYNNVITSILSKEYAINEHGGLHIKCDVEGNPLSTITWFFVQNNTVVKRDSNVGSSSLDLLSANCLDHGNYTVTAENEKGPTATITTSVAVRCKPRLYNTESKTPDKLGIGNDESLEILVRMVMYPPATVIQWTFVGQNGESKVIQNNVGGYNITDTNRKNKHNSSLYKRNVDTEDFGYYIILVLNDVGTFTKIYHVDAAGVQEKVNHKTGIIVGSVVGSVTFIVVVVITLVIFLRRRYNCMINIERKEENVKAAYVSKDGPEISETEQNVQGERIVYEELKERETGNQYEDLSTKGKQASKTQTYQNIQGSGTGSKYEEVSTASKKQDEQDQTYYNIKPSLPTGVYVNTAFHFK